jgi:hypothetical protein
MKQNNKNQSNTVINMREMDNVFLLDNNNKNFDRLMIDRSKFFEQNSNDNTDETEHKFGEITGDMFESNVIDRGLPIRSQVSSKKQQYDQNEHFDFDLFNLKPSSLNVTNFDPSLNDGFGTQKTNYSDISTSMTNISTLLNPVTLSSTQIDKLNNNLFYMLYDHYNYSYMTNGFGLYCIFGSLFFSSTSMTEIELKKTFNFPKRDELYKGLITIKNEVDKLTIQKNSVNFKNFMIIGNDVPYNPEYYDAIRDFTILIRVNTLQPQAEAKKLNIAINKILNTELKNIVTSDNIDKLQLMLLSTCVINPIWYIPFDKVVNNVFYGNENVNINYLYNMSKPYGYYEDNNYQVLEMKCCDKNLIMGIVLHKDKLTHDIDDAKIHYFGTVIKDTIIDHVTIPMFTQNYKIRFNNILKNLGLLTSFQNITCPKFFPQNVVLQDVIQNIKITIDNNFTESYQNTNKLPLTNIKFICNKSFIYYFKLVKTNTIILNGLYQ